MIKPLGKNVLLTAQPIPERTATGIWLVENSRWSSDNYQWLVVSCGPAVPADIQPGARVIVDPTSLAQRDFEHEGRAYKLAPWQELKMVVGVEADEAHNAPGVASVNL
jgi:co-chaperonin GroES (HSP10)